MYIQDNSMMYPSGDLERTKEQLAFEVFPVKVLTADYERIVLTLQDMRSGLVYSEVTMFPANYSGDESNDVTMPEQGAIGLACNYAYDSGFRKIAVITWVNSQTAIKIDAIAQRPISSGKIQGWSDRIRATYRKAYPSQKVASYKGGYSEKIDAGWDRQAADWSRDKLDADRRTWTQITDLKVVLTGSGLALQGPVNRPDADGVTPTTMPDGSQQFLIYLQPGAVPNDRYIDGKPDVIPFAENTQLVQEYALDYIPPMEAIQTDLLDSILGTKGDPWKRTQVASGQIAHDDQTFMTEQDWDHPHDATKKAVGPTLNDGPTPVRRGFIIEKVEGTLVGYNRFDKLTYGKVLKPSLFVGAPSQPGAGRFGADVESGYAPVNDLKDHVEARLAASCMSIRFPYEYNTTRLDVTKEGFTTLEIGSTLPKENIGIGDKVYEHPHGAGRSLEAHLVGSLKAVIGKNRDEEEAIDLQALGQTVIRLGADDTSLPDRGRTVDTQIRGKADLPSKRELQYWKKLALNPGDSGVDLQGYGKKGAENVSLRAALDGAAVVRLGARNPNAKRRHLKNGYKDGKGLDPYGVSDSDRIDSHSPGRPNYGAGDNIYQFHDLTKVGESNPNVPWGPYASAGKPVTDMDKHGLSLDVHAVRDILLRAGKNPESGQSVLLDLAGGLVMALGQDLLGRSITAAMDGAIEITIKPNKHGKALSLNIEGDIDITHKGHLQYQCTGDWITECTTRRHITKTDDISTQQKKIDVSLARTTFIAPDMIHDQGTQTPKTGGENS